MCTKQWPQLQLYNINDILIIWDGSQETLEDFLQYINHKYGIQFTRNLNSEAISFLDLVIFKHKNTKFTKTYFKDSERNGNIFNRSCHPKLIKGIPKGQFMRIK